MPNDHKRINGPEETIPYYLFSKLNRQSVSQKFEEIITNGKRLDGRMLLEQRKVCEYSKKFQSSINILY